MQSEHTSRPDRITTPMCATCGEQLTGRIGDPMGWTWHGCPLGEDDDGNYPCVEQRESDEGNGHALPDA